MRMTTGSRHSAMGNEKSANAGALFLPVRHSSENGFPPVEVPLPAAGFRMRTSDGVVLIALLWVLTALSVIALSFARETRVEVAAARNTQAMGRAYFAARAGIATTIYQLMEKRASTTGNDATSTTVDALDLGEVEGTYGNATYQVTLQEESGKLNVNSVSD
jgi:type II secretory pathway component PulK